MSYETPILMTGNSSNQTIWEAATDARHVVGTRAIMNDGRVFYYACNRGAAIDAGLLVQATNISVDFDDLATNTATENSTTVNVTPVGSATYAVNQLAGGYLSINSGAAGNNGRQYRILANPATTADTLFDLTVEPIREEDFVAGTTATVVPNPYSNVIVSAASEAQLVVGATTFDVPAGSTDPQFFWAQAGGVATVLADVAGIAIGQAIQSGTGTPGAFQAPPPTAEAIPQIIGVNLFTTVDGDYMPVFLNIG